MQDAKLSRKKTIEKKDKLRARKPKLEHVSHDIHVGEKPQDNLRNLYRSIMENTYIGITLIGLDYKILMVNNMVRRYSHKPVDELVGRECFREFEKRDSICPHCPGRKAIITGQPAEAETEAVHDDGSRFPVRIQAFPAMKSDGTVTGFIEIIEDITERKQAEQKLLDYQSQLKSLASQLTLAEERERRRIAIEMHDRISQSLTIVKVKLDGLRYSISTTNPTKTLEEVCNLLGQAITDVRSLTFDLSSPILNELGLEAAVAAWLTEEIEQKHNIIVELEDDKKHKPLDNDIGAILFRNVRELLINVVKHSHATKVKVTINSIGNMIRIGIEDDGVGLIPAEVTSKAVRKGGFGLFSIRERLEQLGGHLEIKSAPGCGCKVEMMASLKKES